MPELGMLELGYPADSQVDNIDSFSSAQVWKLDSRYLQ